MLAILPIGLAVLWLAATAPRAPAVVASGASAFTVCATGCDFATIQAALDNDAVTTGSIIRVVDRVHTEAGIIVSKDVIIEGQGPEETVVQAHDTTEESPDRVFLVEEGATVTIRDLSVRHGNPQPGEEHWRCGGGIANKGTLTVENCVISHNTANDGGGIWNCDGALTVVNSTIHHNKADRVAIEADRQPATAGLSGWACGSGGGIKLQRGGTLTLVGSTVHDNEAMGHGGGIFVACNTTAMLTNCTISGNQATTWGGGLHAKGVLHLTSSTVVNNRARGQCAVGQMAERCPRGAGGGGVFVRATLHFTNTIIANNGQGLDCVLGSPGEYGMTVGGQIGANVNNLVGDASCEAAHSGDPMLGPLSDNGGSVLTHALLPGSPAIDAVPTTSGTLTTDQRGASRPVACVSPETPGDLGAFELQVDECVAFAAVPTATLAAPAEKATPSHETPTVGVSARQGAPFSPTLAGLGLLLLSVVGFAAWFRRRQR